MSLVLVFLFDYTPGNVDIKSIFSCYPVDLTVIRIKSAGIFVCNWEALVDRRKGSSFISNNETFRSTLKKVIQRSEEKQCLYTKYTK